MFQKGDKLRCVDDVTGGIIHGKIYECIDHRHGYVLVSDDTGYQATYRACRFEKVQDVPKLYSIADMNHIAYGYHSYNTEEMAACEAEKLARMNPNKTFKVVEIIEVKSFTCKESVSREMVVEDLV